MKSIKALYLGNARDFLRDRSAVFFVLLLPIVFALFFSTLFGGDGGFTLQLGVVNQDAGHTGEHFVSNLQSDDAKKMLNVHQGSYDEMMGALNEGTVSVVMVLPEDLSAMLSSGTPATVQVYHDPARATSAGVGLGMVESILSEANLAITGAPKLLEMESKSVQTHPMRNVDFYIPGLLGMALLWLGLFGTAAPLVEQRVSQMLRRLSVTPIGRGNILAAQVGWRVTVGLLQTTIFLIIGSLVFGVGVVGSPFLFAGAILMGALVFVSMGYVLAGLASTMDGVVGISQIVNFPMMFLTGTFIPAEMMPSFFKPVMNVLPLTYLNDLLRQLMVAAPAAFPLWMDFAVLGGWLVALLLLATRLWRWE